MNEKSYKKRLEIQSKMISRQSEQIKSLNAEIVKLRLQIEEKDNVINSVASLREKLKQNVEETKKYKEQYKSLIQELKDVKKILTQEVYGSQWKWNLIKFLIK